MKPNLTKHFSTRSGAFAWLARRGQGQRIGDLVTVSKIAGGAADREAEAVNRYRAGARR